MAHHLDQETETMDSPLVEFTYAVQPDGTTVFLGPETVFLGMGPQVRWGNALARLGVPIDRDRLIWRVQSGDRYFVTTATAEFAGYRVEMGDDNVLTLIDEPDQETDVIPGTRHSIPWDAIARVGIVPAPIDSPECA
jgi:hypothetical protein